MTYSVFSLVLLFVTSACSAPRQPVDAADVPTARGTVGSADDLATRFVAAHNAWREEVNVPPLQWSDTLATHAQDWADTLQCRGCMLEHRPDNDYGENLAWASGTRLTPERVVAMWGEEKAFYDYDSNTCARGEVCGHYTQVVWRTSARVGCATARCGDSEVWVCNYDPPGNWVGEKPY